MTHTAALAAANCTHASILRICNGDVKAGVSVPHTNANDALDAANTGLGTVEERRESTRVGADLQELKLQMGQLLLEKQGLEERVRSLEAQMGQLLAQLGQR